MGIMSKHLHGRGNFDRHHKDGRIFYILSDIEEKNER
jgi:hypothetical protein